MHACRPLGYKRVCSLESRPILVLIRRVREWAKKAILACTDTACAFCSGTIFLCLADDL